MHVGWGRLGLKQFANFWSCCKILLRKKQNVEVRIRRLNSASHSFSISHNVTPSFPNVVNWTKFNLFNFLSAYLAPRSHPPTRPGTQSLSQQGDPCEAHGKHMSFQSWYGSFEYTADNRASHTRSSAWGFQHDACLEEHGKIGGDQTTGKERGIEIDDSYLLPLGNKASICPFLLEAPLVELSGDLLFLQKLYLDKTKAYHIEHLVNKAWSLVVDSENRPNGFDLPLSLMRIVLSWK